MNHNFKYTTRFQTTAEVFKAPKSEKETFASVCTASDLSELKAFLPTKEEALKNPDYLYCSFNLFVANQINANGDGVDTKSAIEISKNVKFKPVDLEHNRNFCVGVVSHAGFTEFGTNKVLTEDEVKNKTGPFNVAVSAILWRITGDTDRIVEECSDPKSDTYGFVSGSWEIGYNEYCLCVGSKNLDNCSFITDEKEIIANEIYLRSNGGDGFLPDGREIYRQILDGHFLGLGIVTNPAAAVKGILAMDMEDDTEDENSEVEMLEGENEKLKEMIHEILEVILEAKEKEKMQCAASEKNNENNENKISLLEKPPVKTIKETNMKFTNTKELFAHVQEHESEAFASKAVCDFITEKLSEANDIYVEEKKARDEAEEKLKQSVADAAEFKRIVDELTNKLETLETLAREKEAQDIFDARFSALAEVYDLSDKKLSSKIAKEIKELDEEGFAFWKENDGQVILAGREKEKTKVNIEDAVEALKTATASVIVPNSQDNSEKQKPNLLSLADDIEIRVK